MATFNLASRTYAAGEVFFSPTPVIPQNVIQARITLNLSAAQITNPTTDIEGRLESAPVGTPSDSEEWQLIGFTRLVGNAGNKTSLLPYIEISPSTMEPLHGRIIRATVVNRGSASITFSATLIVS